MRDVVILTEHAPQIASAEEHRARAIVTLETGLLSKMRCDGIYCDFFCSDQAVTRSFISVNVTQARAKIALPKMGICCGPFRRCVDG